MTRLTFLGAAETVTGSKYLLEAGDTQVLFDCGLFQGFKELRQRNWEPLRVNLPQLKAVVLTHAHIDHIGYLPKLYQQGYRGPVYCTSATKDLAEIMLLDAARNQQEDADYANRKGFSKHKPAEPLYTEADARQALKLLRAKDREEWFSPAEPVYCRYHDAGHLLGSAMIEVEVRNKTPPLRILFSGDIGRYDAPLYHDPMRPPPCDILICESTYGDREHPAGNVLDQLEIVVDAAVARGGVMVVPAFAVGRAQQLIYLLQILIRAQRIPMMPIYLDSPMSIDATEIYCAHSADHDLTEWQLRSDDCVLGGKNVHLTRTVDESKQINSVQGPAVIIASSGMMIGGRILHHLKQRLGNARNTIALGGFMAAGTRGRALQDGAARLTIHGQQIPVRAAVVPIPGLSGHAGHSELLRWLEPLPAPRQAFITHGEKPSALSFADDLKRLRGWNARVPRMFETVELEATP